MFNNLQEIEQTIDIIKKAVGELRLVSPFKEKYSFISKN
jgi:cysteine desulfurase